MKREIVITEDGSSSIYLPELEEHYHSFHGALQESDHVFVKQGLNDFLDANEISILEIGFGTGLNCFLAAVWSMQNHIKINYVGLEPNPIDLEVLQKMNYSKGRYLDYHLYYEGVCNSEWEQKFRVHDKFTATKVRKCLQDFKSEGTFDLIFFDAFSPKSQPELWTLTIFTQVYNLMNPGGILVTYCAKGQVKRDLKSAGFTVESLEGPPGKREMLRARKLSV